MVAFINALTGGPMWVHESRVEEYLAAGHKLVSEAPAAKPAKEAPKPKTPAKRKK